jgi:hypothetical protein
MPFARQEKLTAASDELKAHREVGKSMGEATRRHAEQASQLAGLYEEVDKLTKAKSIVPTSDLLVDLVNNLISDAKDLVFRDTYLDRLNKFVAAGNNPNYPELLLALRVLRQSLERFATMMKAESAKQSSIVLELRTILAALQSAKAQEEGSSEEDAEEEDVDEDETELEEESENEEDEEFEDTDAGSNEDDEYVSKNDVRRRLGEEITLEDLLGGNEARKPYDRWFQRVDTDYYFNFAMLDRLGLPKYEPPSVGITFIRQE